MNNPNLIAVAANLSRAYEIAQNGDFSIKIIPGNDNVSHKDIQMIRGFYNLPARNEGDMIIELCYSPQDIMNAYSSKYETLDDINKRIEAYRNDQTEVDVRIGGAGEQLLKGAIDRLELGISDVDCIRKMASVIAKMGGSKKIQVEHIAEAINYKASKDANPFPNGFTNWHETHFEIVSEILRYRGHHVIEAICEQVGSAGLYDTALEWTNEFEKKNIKRDWDGEFFDEVEAFVKSKLNINEHP